MVEDSGNQQFSDFFTLKNKNYGGVPIMVSAEYLTNNLLSFSTTILLNKYQAGKPVQGNIIQDGEEPNYMAVDFAAKLFFRKILYKHVFTPYMTAGPGVRFIDGYQALDPTDNLVEIPKSKDVTINVGFGAFYWIGRTWGINFNYVAKISVKAGSNKIDKSNHLVPSFGIFYHFKND